MKRLTLILIVGLLVGALMPASGQDLFVSSDGAIIMSVPPGWSVMETGPQTLFAIADDGAQLNAVYGAALNEQLADDFRQMLAMGEANGSEPLETTSLVAFGMADAAGIEPVVTSETLRDRDVLRYIDLAEDGSFDAYYVTHTAFTGPIHIAVYGSGEPVLHFLALLDAIDPPPPVAFDCASVTLSQTSAGPGAVLDVSNVPIGLDDFYMQAVAADVEDFVPLPVVVTEDEAVMMSPLYPDFRLDGGPVTIQLVQDGAVCHEIAFEVLPLPDAPGELARFIAAAQDLIDASAAFLGVTRADLLTPPVPDALIPLAEAQFFISHPQNPDALDTLAATISAEELRLVEALLGHDGVVPALEARAAFVRNHTVDASAGTFQFVTDEPLPARVTPFNASTGITITTAQDLSYYMRYQYAFDELRADIDAAIEFVSFSNASIGLGTVALGHGNAISPATSARIGLAGAVISVATLTGDTLIDLYRHLLPSEFTMVYTTLEMPRIRHEDDPSRYRVRDMLVSVRSKEWVLTKTLFDAALTGLGAAGAVRGIKNIGVEAATGRLATYLDRGGDAIAVVDYISNACDAFYLADCETPHITVGPYEWHNISLQVGDNDGLFVEFEVVEGLTGPEPSVQVIPRVYYEPINDGLTVLRAGPNREAFGQQTMGERLHILVDPILVRVDLPRYAEPGEMVCANGEVWNAQDQTTEWWVLDRDGNTLDWGITLGTSPHVFCFDVPETDPSQVTTRDDLRTCTRTERTAYIVVAEAITGTGARIYNYHEKPRRATASVWVQEEDDICDGLWYVEALADQGDVCRMTPTPPGPMPFSPQRIFADLIAAGELDSLVRIESQDQGARLLITDPATGEQLVVPRVSERTTTRDLGVVIVPDVRADGIISELVPEGDGIYRVVTAPIDSTVWADGHHYRYRQRLPVPPPAREIHPMTIDIMFVTPEIAMINHTWRMEMTFSADGTTYHADCILDILYRAQVLERD